MAVTDGLPQKEIDEISDAFSEAWEGYFGEEMFHVPFDKSVQPHSLYGESKRKGYLYDQKTLFHGTFKESPEEEQGDLAGKTLHRKAELTFVTKELRDRNVLEIDTKDIIEVINRDKVVTRYNILATYGKVQLVNNRIFTKLKVVEIK